MSGTVSRYYDNTTGKFVPGNPNNNPNITLKVVPNVAQMGSITTMDPFADAALGNPTDPAYDGSAAAASIEALLRGIYGKLAGTLTTTSTGSNGSVTVSNFPSSQTINGTVTANAGTGTFSTLITNTSLAVTGTFWQATQPISGNVGITGSVAVTGAFYQSTQPVSLTVLPALATGANVIGAVNQNGSWTVNIAASQTISLAAGAQTIGSVNILGGNATAVKVDASATTQPISGGVQLLSGSNTVGIVNVGASVLPSGAATAAKQPALGTNNNPSTDILTVQNVDYRTTGQTIAAATLNAAYTFNALSTKGTVIVKITGLTSSGAILTCETTSDNSGTWDAANIITATNNIFGSLIITDGIYKLDLTAYYGFRLRVSTIGTGTITVASVGSASSSITTLSGPASTGDLSVKVSNAFTRPANTTAYAVGQLVANSTTAASVTPISLNISRYNGSIAKLLRVGLSKNSTSIINTNFRVHFYGAIPTTISNGDGAAWLTSNTTGYLGSVDVTMDKAFTDGANGYAAPTSGSAPILKPATTTSTAIYALIEARAAYTPVSGEIFTLIVEAVQD